MDQNPSRDLTIDCDALSKQTVPFRIVSLEKAAGMFVKKFRLSRMVLEGQRMIHASAIQMVPQCPRRPFARIARFNPLLHRGRIPNLAGFAEILPQRL